MRIEAKKAQTGEPRIRFKFKKDDKVVARFSINGKPEENYNVTIVDRYANSGKNEVDLCKVYDVRINGTGPTYGWVHEKWISRKPKS